MPQSTGRVELAARQGRSETDAEHFDTDVAPLLDAAGWPTGDSVTYALTVRAD